MKIQLLSKLALSAISVVALSVLFFENAGAKNTALGQEKQGYTLSFRVRPLRERLTMTAGQLRREIKLKDLTRRQKTRRQKAAKTDDTRSARVFSGLADSRGR